MQNSPHQPRVGFTLRTLGGLTLIGPDGGEVESLATRGRKLAVLAWLAMRRAPTTRDKIIGVFWGDRDGARARNSLADALSHFRRVLGANAIPAFSERLAFADDVPLIVDAVAVKDAAATRDHARVVELYTGEFLDGVHVDDSLEFERWRDSERMELANLFAQSAAVRCIELARAGEYESCAALARRWLECEPASADAALQLIDALAAPGTDSARVTALWAYEEIVNRVRQELGIKPAAAVVERGRQLAAAAVAPREQSRASRLVGRVAEQHALSRALTSAIDGRGSMICITGEPGIGKTTLVESWLADAVGETAWLASGRCSERLAGAEAYLPLLDALDHLRTGANGAAAAAMLRSAAPLWHAQLGSSQAAPSRARLERELAGFFQQLSRTKPLVLFLDDIHWADSSTVDFLGFLATRLGAMRMLVVATYRDEDMRAARHPFLRLALDLEARGVSREHALPFLSVEDVAQYVERELSTGDATPPLAVALHARTEGSPLFIVELVRELRSRACDDASATVLPNAFDALNGDVPRSLRSMVRRKIERLGDADLRLLTIASVQGVEFDAPVVAAAAGLGAANVEERLDIIDREDALVRRVGDHVFADGTVGARYRFVHALYHDALHASLGPARRRATCAMVAEALVAHAAGKTAALDSQLAYLYENAGDAGRAVHHLTLAGEEAARLFAHREAVSLWCRALALLPSVPETPERIATAVRLHFSVSVSTMIVDGFAAPLARQSRDAAVELAAALGDAAPVFPIMSALFGHYFVAGDVAQSARVAGWIAKVAAGDAAAPPAIMSELVEGMVHFARGECAEAHARFDRAISRYDTAEHELHLALFRLDPGVYALAESTRTLWLLGRTDEAVDRAHQTVDIARGFDHPQSLAFAMTFAAIVHQLRGAATDALAWADRTVALCDTHEIAQERAWVLPVRAWALGATGKLHEGIALGREAIDAYTASGAQHTLPYYHALLADLLLAAGSTTEAIAACEAGLAASARMGEIVNDSELHCLWGECLRRDGDESEATRHFTAALEIARAHGARPYEARAAHALAAVGTSIAKV